MPDIELLFDLFGVDPVPTHHCVCYKLTYITQKITNVNATPERCHNNKDHAPMPQPKNQDQHSVWMLAFFSGCMAFLMTGVAGGDVFQSQATARELVALPPVMEPAAIAPSAIVLNERAVVRIDADSVKFFFASGESAVAKDASKALDSVVQAIKYGKRAQISGYHDGIGDPAINAELAKQRALEVKKTLISMGVSEQQIELRKPEITAATGSPEHARRVEVILVD